MEITHGPLRSPASSRRGQLAAGCAVSFPRHIEALTSCCGNSLGFSTLCPGLRQDPLSTRHCHGMEYDPEIAAFDGSAHLMKLLSENVSMTQEYCEPQKKNGLNLEGVPAPHKPAMLPPGTSKLDATPDNYMVPPGDVYDTSSLNSLFETIPVAPAQQRWQPDSTFKEDPQEVSAVGCSPGGAAWARL